MSKIPTIKVKHKIKKYEMIINECDFDEKKHEKIGEKPVEKKSNKKEKDVDAELKALMGE